LQFDWIFAVLGAAVLAILLIVVIYFIIAGLLLGVALGFVGGKHRDLSSTFVTALLIAIVSPIPCLNCILGLYFIKSRHSIGWGEAALAWILTFVIAVAIALAILLLAFPAIWLAIIGAIPFPIPFP
jgi:hypothetical protein